MKVLEVLPIKFFEFDCEPKLLAKALKETRKLPWIDNKTNWISGCSLNYKKEFKELHQWFQKCLNQVTQTLELPFKCKITQSWANRATSNQWHLGHHHPGSFICGSFYLTTSEGETWFSINDPWKPEFIATTPNREIVYKHPAVAGKLVFFPGSMYHSVGSTNAPETDPRLTIAFNSFPEGGIGTWTGYVNLTVNPVTEEIDKLIRPK